MGPGKALLQVSPTKLAPGNVTQMSHNVETWTISSSLAIIAAARGDWLLKFSQNMHLVLADDDIGMLEHHAIFLGDDDDECSDWNIIRLDRAIANSTLAMACILDYAKMQGAPITAKHMHTWANFRDAVNLLYGLKQSAFGRHEMISGWLVDHGFENLDSNGLTFNE